MDGGVALDMYSGWARKDEHRWTVRATDIGFEMFLQHLKFPFCRFDSYPSIIRICPISFHPALRSSSASDTQRNEHS